MNGALVTSPEARRVESAKTVRMDATVVPADIHHPTDSSLLLDAVRVLERMLRRAEQIADFTAYHNHEKRAKRRALEIANPKRRGTRHRTKAYKDLITLADATVSYAACALAHLELLPSTRSRERLQGSSRRFCRGSRRSSLRPRDAWSMESQCRQRRKSYRSLNHTRT